MPTHRVAVVQAASVPFNLEASVTKAESFIAAAAAQGAKLIVFPEAFLGGYPKGIDFGARVGMRSPEGRRWFQRYSDSALDINGPATARLAAASSAHDAWVVIGVIERSGGTLYCTVLFFSPQHGLLATHRKLMPTAMERLIWGFGDGSTLPVLESPIGRIGAVVCWENYMPLLRMAMYAKGIQLYCAPTVDDRDTWTPSMRHIAAEGRCYVLSACQFIRREAYPPDYDSLSGNDPETVLIRGGSVIVDPLGQILAGPSYGEEAILTADVDLALIAQGKYDLDVTGHYARPDIFHLEVNERPAPAVTFTPGTDRTAPGCSSD